MKEPFRPALIHSSEITPKELYLRRRDFMKAAGLLAGGGLLAACAPSLVQPVAETPPASASKFAGITDELGSSLTTYTDITTYNNYYEFSTSKEAVSRLTGNFRTAPWTVEVAGLVAQPRTFGMEDLLKLFPQEDRIYRLRCVEAWSMVIPWRGFPLAQLLKLVQPLADGKYVRFTTLEDREQFPAQGNRMYPWPYQEGLRLDEAMNDLTLLATGLYGEDLPVQDGAPIRLVVPWKYGFKSAKAIVKIELVEKQPDTFWKTIAPDEYGFYANVNPQVPHPRWLQVSERRIGELTMRPTLMFNGYADQVASMYSDMDLSLWY